MAQININIDDAVKMSAEKACEDMGITMTTAINIYLVKLGRERKIPFEIAAEPDPFYSPDNIAELKRRIEEVKSGKAALKEHELFEVDE